MTEETENSTFLLCEKTEYWKLEKLTIYTKTVTSNVLRKYLHFSWTLNFKLYKKVAHTIVIYIHFRYDQTSVYSVAL